MSKTPIGNKQTSTPPAADSGLGEWTRYDSMSDEEVLNAASQDDDALPMTETALGRMHRVALVKRLRWRLRMGQQEAADVLGTTLEQVKRWERNEGEPNVDQLLLLLQRTPNIRPDAAHLDPAFQTMPQTPLTYRLFCDHTGSWSWHLNDAGGKLLAVSGITYPTESSCRSAIAMVQQSTLARVA